MPATLRRRPKKRTPSRRSLDTRDKLVAAAERLFAARGIENVSLREIARAADQRNTGALQYHFGDRNAVVQAVLDKHVPAVQASRRRMLEALEKRRRIRLRELVQAFVMPNAARLDDADGGRDYILIRAQLAAEETLGHLRLRRAARHPSSAVDVRLAALLREKLQHVPEPIFAQRMAFSISLMFHGLADLIRMTNLTRRTNPILRQDMAIESLVCSVEAILSQPISRPLAFYCAREGDGAEP